MAFARRASFSSSAFWVALEVVGGSVFSSLGLIVIAGLIGPADLGLAAVALGFAQTANFFTDTLYQDAIIQRRRLSPLHVGSALWSVLLLAVVLGGGMALLAGWIGRLYGQDELSRLLLVLAPLPIASAITSIQTARLRRAMQFRILTINASLSRALATAAGLALALKGYGAWAVIAQYGLGVAILGILYSATMNWRLARRFSLAHAWEITSFGARCTSTYFLDGARGRLFFAVIANYLPLAVVGQVNLAWRVVDSLATVIASALVRLYLPFFSRVQAHAATLRSAVQDANLLTAALLGPVFAVLALTSDDLVRCIGSAKWQGLEILLPWLCAGAMGTILRMPATVAMTAIGQPLLATIGLAGVFVATFGAVVIGAPTTGVYAVLCWTLPLIANVPFSMVVASRCMGLSLRDQVGALLPAVLMTGAVTLATVAARQMAGADHVVLRLLHEIPAAGISYLILAAIVLDLHRRRRRTSGATAVPVGSVGGVS
jgi:PST family polysaccharide transporter